MSFGVRDEMIYVCGLRYYLVAVTFYGTGHYVTNARFVDNTESADTQVEVAWYHYDDMSKVVPGQLGALLHVETAYDLPKHCAHFRPTMWYYVTQFSAMQRSSLADTIEALHKSWAIEGFRGIYDCPPQPGAFRGKDQ